MATITTSGLIGGLIVTPTASASDILTNVGDKFYSTLVSVYDDVIYGNFSIDTLTSTYLEGSLYGLGGSFAIMGSGFYSSSPRVNLLAYSGNDGFEFGIKGLFTASSLKLSEVDASWNGESILFKGSLDENGYGKVTSVLLEGGGLAWTLGGSMTFAAEIGGSLKSLTLADGAGNSISVSGSLTYDAVESVATVNDLFDVQSLYGGSDTFNVPDGSRGWHGYGGKTNYTEVRWRTNCTATKATTSCSAMPATTPSMAEPVTTSSLAATETTRSPAATATTRSSTSQAATP